MLSLIFELSHADYVARKIPLWLAKIPGEELVWVFDCSDDLEGTDSSKTIKVYRKMRQAA